MTSRGKTLLVFISWTGIATLIGSWTDRTVPMLIGITGMLWCIAILINEALAVLRGISDNTNEKR